MNPHRIDLVEFHVSWADQWVEIKPWMSFAASARIKACQFDTPLIGNMESFRDVGAGGDLKIDVAVNAVAYAAEMIQPAGLALARARLRRRGTAPRPRRRPQRHGARRRDRCDHRADERLLRAPPPKFRERGERLKELAADTAPGTKLYLSDDIEFAVADRWNVDPYAVRHVWPEEMVSRALQIMTIEVERAESAAAASREARKMAFLRGGP